MPLLEVDGLTDKAVLWTQVGRDRYNELVLGTPSEIDVRWETRRRQVIGPDGSPLVLEADVMVDREIPLNSLMWKGKLVDWNPALKNELMSVVFTETIPDEKGREIKHEVSLTKYKQKLPT